MTPSRAHLSIAQRHQVEVQAAIDRHGFHATHVLGDQFHPPFSYTTGFLLAGHPELVILGLETANCRHVFGHLMEEVRAGVVRPVGRDAPNELDGVPLRLLPVPVEHWRGGDCLLLGFASYYGPRQHPVDEHSFLQLVWPDANHRFPWDDDIEPAVFRDQPVLADGDAPRRRWPLDEPVDNQARCSLCCADPRNRAERRRQARGRGRG